jgi:hypothetical protein
MSVEKKDLSEFPWKEKKNRRAKFKFSYHEPNAYELWEAEQKLKKNTNPPPPFLEEYKFLYERFNKIALNLAVNCTAQNKTTIKVSNFRNKVITGFLDSLNRNREELDFYERGQLRFGHVFDLALEAAAPYGISRIPPDAPITEPLYYFLKVKRSRLVKAENRKLLKEPRTRQKKRENKRRRMSL